jgi:hypothetical protein
MPRLFTAIMVTAGLLVSLVTRAETQSASPFKAVVSLRKGVLSIAVNDVKPLFRAVYELEKLCGCPITYEDAPLENAADVVEVSAGAVAGRRGLYQRGGKLEVSYPVDSLDVSDNVERAVREIVRIYEDQKLPGVFRVERDGAMLHVIPDSVRSKDGLPAPTSSVLDALISFPQQERSGLEAINAVLDAVRSAGGTDVDLGEVPMNLLASHRVSVGAHNDLARTVLARILSTHAVPLSWGIGYDISTKRYGISIHPVVREAIIRKYIAKQEQEDLRLDQLGLWR